MAWIRRHPVFLEWIVNRCENTVDAEETAIGLSPKAEDINIEGLDDFSLDTLKAILAIDKDKWAKEAAGVEESLHQIW